LAIIASGCSSFVPIEETESRRRLLRCRDQKLSCSSFVPIEETESIACRFTGDNAHHSCSSFVPIEETESASARLCHQIQKRVAVRSFR